MQLLCFLKTLLESYFLPRLPRYLVNSYLETCGIMLVSLEKWWTKYQKKVFKNPSAKVSSIKKFLTDS